jgi:hypothetical protein
MKQILFIFLLICSFWNYGMGQINFQGCPAEFGTTTYVLVPIGTTNDGGVIRNTYDTSPIDGAQACNGFGFGFCEFRIIWDVAANEWLFQITDGASFFTIYTNTSPSAPNPPDLTLGTWVEDAANTGGACGGNLTTGNSTLSGDVQSSVSACSNPTVPTVTLAPTGICAGSTTTLTISGTLNDATNWHIYSGTCGGTLVGMTATSSFVVTPSVGTTTYFVRGEDGTGCVDELTGVCGSAAVTVNATPATPTISAGGATTFCMGGSVTLTSSASSGNQWAFNGTPLIGAVNQTYTVVGAGAGSYTVVATANGCPSNVSSATVVTINANPATPTISAGGATTFCTGGSVTLTSSASSGNQWLLNGSPIGGATNQTLVVTTGGNYTVMSTVNGCPSNASSATVVTVNPLPPTPAINAGGAITFCTGGSVSLSTPSSTGLQWLLNGNPIGGATNQTYVATTGGNYSVSTTINGCGETSAIIPITVNAIPATPTISAGGSTTFCTGGSVTLTSSASSGNQWFLNGSSIGGATNQTLVATTSGNYTVEATANGCTSSTSSATAVTVNLIPNSTISTPITTVICNGGSVTLTSLLSTGNQWFLNGSAITGANSQTFVATVGGNYTVENTINGCTSGPSGIIAIVENTMPPTIISTSSTTFCMGDSVTLTSSASSGNQWIVDGNLMIGATSQTLVVTAGGLYSTQVTNNSCISNSNLITIIANAIPATPTISAGGSTTFCTGDSVTLTSSASSGNQWSLDGSIIGGATGQTLVATTSGIYTVAVTTNGCTSSASTGLTVVVNQIPFTPAIVATSPATFCMGDSVTLSTNSSTGSNQWSLNGSSIGGATGQFLVATIGGNYTVDLTINGCSSTSSIMVVTVNNPVTNSQTLVECAGSSVSVGSNTYTVSGTYTDTLSAANACDSIITTNLTILAPIGSTLNQTICAGESITVNGVVYDSTVVGATQTYTGTGGACDSVVTINLTVLAAIDTTITTTLPTLTANAATASYQWVNCDSSYTPLAGATAQAYTPTMNGNYAVIITEGACSDTSSCYAVIITGIKNNKLTKMLSLFPNPTSGNLSIELGQIFNEVTIKVMNVTGQTLSSKSFRSTDQIDFNIEGTSGVYLLEIRTDEGDLTTIKVLKK